MLRPTCWIVTRYMSAGVVVCFGAAYWLTQIAIFVRCPASLYSGKSRPAQTQLDREDGDLLGKKVNHARRHLQRKRSTIQVTNGS